MLRTHSPVGVVRLLRLALFFRHFSVKLLILQHIVALFPVKFSLFARLSSLLLRFAGGCELERWSAPILAHSRAASSLGRAITPGSTVSQKDEGMETIGTREWRQLGRMGRIMKGCPCLGMFC